MRLQRAFLLFGCVFLCFDGVFAQGGSTVFGAGYSLPLPVNAAPGQILNLFVAGVGAGLTGRVTATSLPLPYMIAGISVNLVQTVSPQTVPVPLLAVRPVSTCGSESPFGSANCGQYTIVTVQVPYELVPPCQSGGPQACPSSAPANSAQLVVSESGVSPVDKQLPTAVALNPLTDQIHVATSCDLDSAASLIGCVSTPLVTHADGTLVTAAKPANIGEEIVIYALGLGGTNPAAQTGQAAPSPAATVQNLAGVEYNYSINAPPSEGIPAPLASCALGVTCPVPPAFAGLTSGMTGLYQVNVVVPPSTGVFPCGAGVISNLTITLVGATSYDGAGICVAPSSAGGPSSVRIP